MAEEEIARHVAEAQTRWPLLGVTVIHRYGRMQPGDNIVLVVTASAHRQAAFEAASFLMDYLKTRAPFWKLEESAGRQGLGRGERHGRRRGGALGEGQGLATLSLPGLTRQSIIRKACACDGSSPRVTYAARDCGCTSAV